jgi:hypothetical protein
MGEELSPGPGTAVARHPDARRDGDPTDTVAAMIAWLFRHGGPRTGEVLARLERHGWTLELPYPGAVAQTELWASARFPDVEQARAAARPFQGRVSDLMRWTPADRPADAMLLPFAEQPGR